MGNKFILDCSVTLAWRLDDESCPYAETVFDSLQSNVAVVPVLWHLEVANTLSMAKNRERVSESQIYSFLKMLDSLPIETSLCDITKRDLVMLSQEYSLTAYDACYLNLSITNNLPLATLDKKLMKALLDAGGKMYSP